MAGRIRRFFGMDVPDHEPNLGDASERSAASLKRSAGARRSSALTGELGGSDGWTRVPEVMSDIDKVAKVCAMLPVSLRRETENGKKWKVINMQDPTAGYFVKLLRRPNLHQSPFEFYCTVFNQLLAYGNVYLYKYYGEGKSAPSELYVLDSRAVDFNVERTPLGWEKVFRYRSHAAVDNDWRAGVPGRGGKTDVGSSVGGNSPARGVLGVGGTLARPLPDIDDEVAELTQDEVIHITGQTLNLGPGVAPVYQYARRFNLAAALEIIATAHAANYGMRPLMVTAKDPFIDESKLEEMDRELQSRGNFEQTIHLMQGDWDVKELGTGMENMGDFHSWVKKGTDQIFGIPGTLAGEEDKAGSSKGAEEMTRLFKLVAVDPAIRAVADGLRDGLAPEWHKRREPLYVFFDTSRLVEANILAQTDHFESMLQQRVMTRNEVRRALNMEPVDGGDKFDDPMAINQGDGGRPRKNGDQRSATERQRNSEPSSGGGR